MAAGKKHPVLIKKVKKGRHDGHHGGAWKVAYADFVTAMMAFFLLLWLLAATTEEQREGIAQYFQPTLSDSSSSGSNGLLGGTSMAKHGAMPNSAGPPVVMLDPQAADREESEELVARAADKEAGAGRSPEEADNPDDEAEPQPHDFNRMTRAADRQEAAAEEEEDPLQDLPAEDEPDEAEVDDKAALARIAELEEKQFKKAEAELRRAIEEIPELHDLAQNLVIDRTPEGMRIQIIDQANVSMFEIGSSRMLEHTRTLLQQVATVVAQLPNKLAISGHTDARPYASDRGYSNWELSSDRANASRRALIEAGLGEARIASVTGRADKEPFVTDDPFSPRNRRISIVLLYETHHDAATR